MVRPVRPARCRQLLREHHSNCSDVKLVVVSTTRFLVRQKSITGSKKKSKSKVNFPTPRHGNLPYFTSGTVTELSAMFVARIIIRLPGVGFLNALI